MSQSPRVVIIEDHALLRELLAALVRDVLGFTLAGEAGTVREGVELCGREKPDLVILDWMLPDGRGFEVVRQAGGTHAGTRWILVSSNEQGHLVREAVQLGIQGFVMKRADLSTLRTAISQVLAGETYYCPVSARLLVDRMVGESQVTGGNLSPREQVVLRGFARGENPKVLADRLGVSPKTVQNHLSALREKLGLYEPAELVHYAIKHGYIEAP